MFSGKSKARFIINASRVHSSFSRTSISSKCLQNHIHSQTARRLLARPETAWSCTHPGGIPAKKHAFVAVRIRITRVSGKKMAPVAIGPAHCGLPPGVQPAKIRLPGHLQHPPAGRFGAAQDNFQLISRGGFARSGFKVGKHRVILSFALTGFNNFRGSRAKL